MAHLYSKKLQEVNRQTNGRYTVNSGFSAGVGPFGLTSNMGITVLNGMVGNGADSIYGVECVTANREFIRAVEGDDMHAELLRAIVRNNYVCLIALSVNLFSGNNG